MKQNVLSKAVMMFILLHLAAFNVLAQDDSTTAVADKPKKDKRPVK
jgi:hypothetical protein